MPSRVSNRLEGGGRIDRGQPCARKRQRGRFARGAGAASAKIAQRGKIALQFTVGGKRGPCRRQ